MHAHLPMLLLYPKFVCLEDCSRHACNVCRFGSALDRCASAGRYADYVLTIAFQFLVGAIFAVRVPLTFRLMCVQGSEAFILGLDLDTLRGAVILSPPLCALVMRQNWI